MSKVIRTQKPSVLPWYAAALVFAVLCAALGGTIRGAETVNKSYPDFFRTLRALGLRMDVRP